VIITNSSEQKGVYENTIKHERDSSDTRNRTIDNYGNEVREFVIGHPHKTFHADRSHKISNSFSQEHNLVIRD
jgi:hypothetical protein